MAWQPFERDSEVSTETVVSFVPAQVIHLHRHADMWFEVQSFGRSLRNGLQTTDCFVSLSSDRGSPALPTTLYLFLTAADIDEHAD